MIFKTLVIVFLIVSCTNCDWVEIPQNTKDKYSKTSDYTHYILTTTSTTTQTPIFSKPPYTRYKNGYNTAEISTSSFEPPILTTQSVKKNVLPHTTLKPSNKQNFTKGQVYKIDKPNLSAKGPPLSNTDFKRRSSSDEFEEVIDEANFIDNEASYSYTGFIPFLSKIQNALMKNTHKNKKSKLNVLSGLRDHLLYEIQSRMSHLWKPKTVSRGSKDYKEDSHIDFPSNESALMTIGFLTFAVFLIKLVMQLINAVSSNATTTMIVGRKRREKLNEEVVRILNHIEQYTLK